MKLLLNAVARLGPTLFVLALVNFFAFVVVALALGGDALNGKAVDGVYYLSNHGKLTEVSRGVWNYSYWHTISIFITHPLGILTMALHDRERARQQSN